MSVNFQWWFDMHSVLVIEDNRTMREGLEISLKQMGLDVCCFDNGAAALDQLGKKSYDLLITDYKLPGMDGLEVLKRARTLCPDVDMILITAYGSVNLAVEAMKQGAADFLTKPFSPEELRVKVEKALASRDARAENIRLAEENEFLRSEVAEAGGYGELVGESESMLEVFNIIERVALTDSSVLITGESGTGKELVARAIHEKSQRKAMPFVKVSCAALSEGVLESELFGHEKGAFTGSVKARKGRFELAHGGTLFLDEIGDISPTVQVKLLRVLQEHRFERVGGEKTLTVDVRLVSATNKDLNVEVEKGNFRGDLFYRLHVVPIELPPLRARVNDIQLLARHMAAKICRRMNLPPRTFDSEALDLLEGYNWPGNVRELENVIERALVLGHGKSNTCSDIPPLSGTTAETSRLPPFELPPSGSIDLTETLETTERRIIERVLERAHGNKSKAARMLGLKVSALHYKLDKYGIV